MAHGTNARVTAACSEAAIDFARDYRSGVAMAKSTITAPQNDRATIQGAGSVIDSSGLSGVYDLELGGYLNLAAGIRSMHVTTNQDDAGAIIQNQITLRDAIETGNNGPPAPAVTFAGNVTSTISLQAALPAIQASYNINGPGASTLTVQGNGNANNPYRIFTVNAGVTSAIGGLTIMGGFAQGSGGGIQNDSGILTLSSDNIKSNQASNVGGVMNDSYISRSCYLIPKCYQATDAFLPHFQ